MPKKVDHEARRRELADAACRVIARRGLREATLADVAGESGWSIGSIRHYYDDKDALIEAALWRTGERVDERIRRKVGDAMGLRELRVAALELLPLDAQRRDEARVHLAFLAQASVAPALAGAANDADRRLQEPFVQRFAHASDTGELMTGLDPEHEAARLRLLLDGLTLQLLTAPRRTTQKWARAAVDAHLAALGPAGTRR